MAKILVTGATGFIGKRLIYKLLESGHEVYALNRIQGTNLQVDQGQKLHVLYGDLKDPRHMDPFPKEIEVAYYLVHSMGSFIGNLLEEELKVASNFLQVLEKTSCKQIIFLSGIVEDSPDKLSPHLRSRFMVEEILNKGTIPVTVLRSSIIIGSGSASFEIIRDLVEKLPLMVAPKWVNSVCQPIAIRDVLFYLEAVMLKSACFHQKYDIGGPESLSFKEVLLRYAKFRKLKRYIIDVPFLTPKLSSYWLVLISSVRYSICRYLIESMKNNTRKLNLTIDSIIPHNCLSFEQALDFAFQKISQNEVVSTWMDAWNISEINPSIQSFLEVPTEGCFRDNRVVPIEIPIEVLQTRIWSIGGEQGWYSLNWAWRIRGLIDQLVGGTGLNRGRRDPHKIQPGDSIDFWRVILADEKKRQLILYAEMKLPGEAWLEFKIDPVKHLLRQTATFRPLGIGGRAYWYLLLPFHLIIFRRMAKKLSSK